MQKQKIFLLLISLTTSFHLFAHGSSMPDSAFIKKNNPDLIYTTREYYFDVPENRYDTELFIKDFRLILVFNIGVTMQNDIKQLGFNKAILDFSAKQSATKNYTVQSFITNNYSFSEQGYKLAITFVPEKKGQSKTASTTAVNAQAVQKCVFEGVVTNKGVTGTLTFYTTSGHVVPIKFNPF